jgi:hypothetical protein
MRIVKVVIVSLYSQNEQSSGNELAIQTDSN